MTNLTNAYYSDARVEEMVQQGRHRELVGGLWDELGPFQLSLMQSAGLKPDHKLLDIGCGALRAGVEFAAFLNPGNYYGQDLRPELIEAGYNFEIRPAGLDARLPRSNLIANSDFNFDPFGTKFDFAIAFSLFTHLPLNHIRICLERLSPHLNPGGKFLVTFFQRGEDDPSHLPKVQPPGIVTTQGAIDPFHYSLRDFEYAANGLPFDVKLIGDIGHPRGQRAIQFEKRQDQAGESVRGKTVAEAAKLPAGADHYRAYVGPPGRFDIMSASQFALLFQFGLRDWHSVLDFGCGSLRLGRLAIPFLQPQRYFGIDPNKWLIDEGIARELGESAIQLKQPKFDYNERFDCGVFGRKFDFIIAQSIVTHTGPDLADALFASAAANLEAEGLFFFSFIDPENNAGGRPATPGWHYPHCVAYPAEEMHDRLQRNGLVSRKLNWHHPGATWRVAATSLEALPSESACLALTGIVAK